MTGWASGTLEANPSDHWSTEMLSPPGLGMSVSGVVLSLPGPPDQWGYYIVSFSEEVLPVTRRFHGSPCANGCIVEDRGSG